ncbi:hypothetical protein LOD99_11909 [Oopsacas minuta]|uniref:V(D)J recombination-activating protein 1 RNase H domain-containing protein n=1 Tax=Oopsacas minuta TaxID=111878 RepID=A0AAV7JHN2_9METZ|nr:hypothetical protein LOD99_11909 [Oopsacas minuta]
MSVLITNNEAYSLYISNGRSVTVSVRKLIENNHLSEEETATLHLKFKSLLTSREAYRRKDLETWDNMIFHSTHLTISNPRKRISLDPEFSLVTDSENRNFSEQIVTESRKHILECHMKTSRSRLGVLLEHVDFLAEREKIEPKQLLALALELVSNKSYDCDTSDMCREIIDKGSFSGVLNKVQISKCAYILDRLEIGASKYTNLKRILKGDVKLPSYKLVSQYRREISLINEMEIVRDPEALSIGTCVSYHSILSLTIQRLLSTLDPVPDSHYPLKIKISDGLDGSGCHQTYNQQSNNSALSTKTFILFGFKVISITDTLGNDVFYNSSPNSPFCFRPVALIALKEDYSSVKLIMNTIVNPQTDHIIQDGLSLIGGHAQVEIVRSLFDTKMAGLLDGAGGASCHLCTATDSQIKSLEWAHSGFPINRLISDARQLFEEVDEEDYLKLPSNQRVGITHQPTSNIDIIAASPLHAYLCVFRWFMLLIYHLDAGHKVWAPSNSKVNFSMKRVRAILQERCNFSVDIPSSQGGTSTTGNIARDCFLNKRDFLTWATSSINPSDKISLEKIQTNLSVLLRLLNSGDLINCDKMQELCKETYEFILIEYPWASITPSLHKLLAHSFQLIGAYNNGKGLQNLSEECLESCNKFVRRYRENLARKTSFTDNVRDILVRLLCCSDPILVQNRLMHAKKKRDVANSLQEILYNSILSDDL